MINNIYKTLSKNSKEYIILFAGLLAQSFFGYQLVTNASNSMQYSATVSVTGYVLLVLGFMVSSCVILYVGFLFLKNKTVRPLKMLIKYVGVYCLAQIVLAVLMGVLALLLGDSQVQHVIYTFTQYVLRYLVLGYVFLDVYKKSLRLFASELLYGFVGIVFVVFVQVFITNHNMLYIIVESLIYFVFVIYLYVLMLRRGS